MTWTVPIDPPAAGSAITRAFYITYVKDNLSHLRTVTGGDPVGANLALIAAGAGVGSWQTIPDAAMTNPKVSKAGDAMTGRLELLLNTIAPAAELYANANIIITTTNATHPSIGLHKSGSSGVAIYWDGSDIRAVDNVGTDTSLVRSTDNNTITINSPGQLKLPYDGSATAPLIAIGSAGNTGFYHGGANQINVTTQGTQRGWITDSGIILWGASPPTETVAGQKLRIDGRALATAWDVVSSRKDKRNIEPVSFRREDFLRLEPARYRRVYHGWDATGATVDELGAKDEIGLVAEDVAEVFPDLSAGASVDQYGLLTVCVAMLQDTMRRIALLEQRGA